MATLIRSEEVTLEFSVEFAMWMIGQNFHGEYTCEFLCNGWEL